jgi:hypothetical protein
MGAHSRPEQTGQASGFSELRPGAQKRRSLKQKRGLRWPQLVFLLFILAFVVSIGLFSWDRWFRYDDAKDFRGEWTQVSAAAPSGGSGLMPPEGTSDGDAGLADGASQDGGTAAEGSGATDGSGATEGSGATAEGQGMEDGQGLEGGIMPESQGAPDGGIASDGAGLTTSNTAQGQASASTPVSINDKKIQLTPEVSYEYTLDTWSKTVVYTFGTMRGSGKYRFSQDRKKLVIIEGGTDDWILAARIALGLAEPEEGTDPAKTTILVKP